MRSAVVLSSFALLVPQFFSPVIARSPQPLAFQLDPSNVPALSFESWADVQNSPAGSHSAPKQPDWRDSQPAEPKSLSPDISRDLSEALQGSLPLLSYVRNVVKSFATLGFGSSSFTWYNHPVPPVDCSKYTIWEILNWTLHNHPKESSGAKHTLPLYRLAWLANLSHPVQEALSDSAADLTLFAPDDKALTPPSKKKRHLHRPAELGRHGALGDDLHQSDAGHPFWEALDALEGLSHCPHMRTAEFFAAGEDGDSRKKKIILRIIESVLKYHVSPGSKSIPEILDSSTIPTALEIECEPAPSKLRVRVGAPPPFDKPGQVALNFFTRIDTLHTRPIRAKNGIIYIAHHVPLLPPLSPLSHLFLFPSPFSTVTTALQKIHLDKLLLPTWGNKTIPFGLGAASNDDELSLDDAMDLDAVDERVRSILASLSEEKASIHKRSFTVFAPTNRAFRSLGPHVNSFLFSPFGVHILRYVLSYHIVPDVIWHTDFTKNLTESQSLVTRYETEIDFPEEFYESALIHDKHHHAKFRPHLPSPPIGKVNITELALPTLLGSRKNESLSLSLVQFRHLGKGPISRRVYIKQNLPSRSEKLSTKPPNKRAIPVIVPDGVAWGGAIHVIPQLIRPPIPEGHKHRKDVARAAELSILSHDQDKE